MKDLNVKTGYLSRTIPLAFDESMSYYEFLCGLLDYLKNTVIPAVEENEEKVNELEASYEELKGYVDHYFDNLDVQQEINNKLDEMAESGELTEIIAQYLELAGILAYNTKADMKNAENLNDGSFCKTYGDLEYNDGKGRFYKVRTVTTGDIIDDVNIIALANYDTLVAELIPDYYMDDLTERVGDIEEDILDIGAYIGQLNEKIENVKDYYNIKPTNLFFYDLGDNGIQGCCVDDNNILYVAKMGSSGSGTLLKFNISNLTYVGETSSFTLYHGNDMAYLDGKIYIASATDSGGSTNNKKIVIYDIANNTSSEINPFSELSSNYIGFISTYDSTHLLCGLSNLNSNSVTIDNYSYYLLDITDNSYEELTFTNTSNLPIHYYGYVQSLEYLNGFVYIETSFNNSIIKLKLTDTTLNVDKIYPLNNTDEFCQPMGEIEGLCKIPSNLYGNDTLLMTSTLYENTTQQNKVIQGYLINTTTNLPLMLFPHTYDYNTTDTRDIVIVNTTSTSIYENGTSTYPFKRLNRAINFAQSKIFTNVGYIRVDSGNSFTLGNLTNKDIKIVNNTSGNITISGTTQFIACKARFYSKDNSTSYSFIFANTLVINDTTGFIQFGTYRAKITCREKADFKFYGGSIALSPSDDFGIETYVACNIHVMLDSVTGFTNKMFNIGENSICWLNATMGTANSYYKAGSSYVYKP